MFDAEGVWAKPLAAMDYMGASRYRALHLFLYKLGLGHAPLLFGTLEIRRIPFQKSLYKLGLGQAPRFSLLNGSFQGRTLRTFQKMGFRTNPPWLSTTWRHRNSALRIFQKWNLGEAFNRYFLQGVFAGPQFYNFFLNGVCAKSIAVPCASRSADLNFRNGVPEQ